MQSVSVPVGASESATPVSELEAVALAPELVVEVLDPENEAG